MSNLPSELTDHIIDLLHDSQAPLRSCCLVSKSWVPRTRMHLFAKVEFQTAASLESWKKTFRDPSTSPACYTKTLLVDNSKVLTDADAEGNGWIGDFSRVVHFTTVGPDPASFDRVAVLLPFHGFSPFLKSLRVHHTIFSLSQLFDPIFSFPLLEDLSITDCCCLADKAGDPDEVSTTIQPASPPMFTGSLELFMTGMIRPVHWLLSLPGGIHFRKLTLTWTCKEDISLTMALLEKCSHTLESLDVTCGSLCGTSIRILVRMEVTYFVFQSIQCRSRSISQKRRSSDMRFFGLNRWESDGSRACSGPSQINIKLLDEFRLNLMSSTLGTPHTSTEMSGKPSEKRFLRSGWTSIVSWCISGSRFQFA